MYNSYLNSSYKNISDINPFRYRGYYYDTETGFYYLNSRYYDPEHVHIYGDDISDKVHGIRIGMDGKPLPKQEKLPPGARKA